MDANILSAGAMMAFGLVFLLIFLAVYIYAAVALMYIARKTKTGNGWFAFIPILNFYLITQMAKKSGWWTLILLAAAIPLVGGIIVAIASVWLFWLIAEKINLPGWTSVLMIIPLVNLVILGVYAWSK